MALRIILLLSTLMTLALVHIVSIELYLYWKYLWLDIPVHFAGGIAVALGFSILPFYNINLPQRYTGYVGYVGAVLVVGILWELFEYFVGISIYEPGFITDTLTDLTLDVFGTLVGYSFVKRLNTL